MNGNLLRSWAAAALLLSACSMSDSARMDGSDDGAGTGACYTSEDCPRGLVCESFRCVASDSRPPEQEEKRTFLRPAAAGRYVFALSPEAGTVAVIDSTTLSIASVVVPAEPVASAVMPGRDAVLVLSRQGRAVSLVTMDEGRARVQSVATPRRFSAVSLSADGARAVLWTPDGAPLDAGAEGIVAVVDVSALALGEKAEPVERAAGRRHTDVFFRLDPAGRALEAVVLGKSELAVLNLADPGARPVPERMPLPADFAEVLVREAAAPPNGAYLLLRSLATRDIAVFDVAARRLRLVALPGVPSDLAMAADGRFAVAVLREKSQVAWFPLPQALEDAALLRVADAALPARDCEGAETCTAAPGQAVLAPDASFALLFTNARGTESLGRLDFAPGRVSVLDRLQKLVRTAGVSPDGASVLVLHQPEPGSTLADEYERTVDRAEGYSAIDLASGTTQLKLTGDVPALEFAFTPSGRHAAVALRSDARRAWSVDSVDLRTLVTSSTALASAPQYAGALPDVPGAAERVWVTQEHPAGRISVLGLASGEVRTATGFDLNSEIE